MPKLILYRGTPNTPIETYEIDGKEDVLIDLDAPGNKLTNGYNGKLIHQMTQYGWTYHSSPAAYMFEFESIHATPSSYKPCIFEHPTHGMATVYHDDNDRTTHTYIVGPAAHQLAEDLRNAYVDIYDENHEDDE